MTELSIGRISINGRVGQEPEVRYFASGSQVAKINLAVESYVSGQKETMWFNDIEIWRPQADIVAKYVSVGDRVTVGGDYTVQELPKGCKNSVDLRSLKIPFCNPYTASVSS